MGLTEREQLQDELGALRSEVPVLRAERTSLIEAVEPLRQEAAQLKQLTTNVQKLRDEVVALGNQRAAIQAELAAVPQMRTEAQQLATELSQLREQLVETRETVILQEVGLYEYRHPLEDAVAYKTRLNAVRSQIKDAARAGHAVQAVTNWTVNGSAAQGNKMVREFSKLMLRAYNAEADNAVRSMKPYTLESALARLNKVRGTIAKLGSTMNIHITDHYHQLQVSELELTADYLAKTAEEKERERADRERLRDEERARREIEREQERLRKEQEHYRTVLAAHQEQGNTLAAAEAETKLEEITDGLDGLNRRAANIRAGYVYVISNIGSFGPRMVKIGLTRRLDPMDRVRELGDASVPFRYDVHLLTFSEDAVGLETHLHHTLADRRVNMVNNRREFFYATPQEVREALEMLDEQLLTYTEEPEALEWRQSETVRGTPGDSGLAASVLIGGNPTLQ